MFTLKAVKYVMFMILSSGNSYEYGYHGMTAVFDDKLACEQAVEHARTIDGVYETWCEPQSSNVQIPFRLETQP